jgi:hypothetical protein
VGGKGSGNGNAEQGSARRSDRATVLGEPLEEGERVLFYVQPSYTLVRALLLVFGVVLLAGLLGCVLIAYGLLYERWALRFVAITNRRLLVKKGERRALSIALADVIALKPRRHVGAGLVAPSKSAPDTQLAPGYWKAADSLLVQGRHGSLAIDRRGDLPRLGPALARAAFEAGWVDREPTARFPR